MHEILTKEQLTPETYRVRVRAPRIAKKRQPGQFVVLRVSRAGERIPLTIADADPQSLSITLVFQVVGRTTRQLAALGPGDEICDVVGPLGRPTELQDREHVVCMGGGLGIALIYPIATALRPRTTRLTGIISARSAALLFMEDQLGSTCDELLVATDDGSRGHHGFPTALLEEMLAGGRHVDAVYAVGPVPMMAAVAEVTRPFGVKTIASLNPIMLDGTGMCGGCRVTVGGETRFACVDGPEFDAHQVDFQELARRLRQYEDDPAARRLPRYESAGGCSAEHTSLQQAMLDAGRSAEKATKIPRQPMPEQDPARRVRNFQEVPFGLTPEQAVLEAKRCLQCNKPRCVDGCPVGVKIPEFIALIVEGKFAEACRKIKEDNTLPAICGRVCPQEDQCEAMCVLGKRADPVAIGNLERFVADYERTRGLVQRPERAPERGRRVAVVGSGPAGLTAASELARLGYTPIILEALHEPGGVLTYGIPEFRLPKEIVRQEVDFVRSLGVEITTNFVVGKTATVVLSANEYLTRVNLMRAYDDAYETPVMVRRRVAVLGGGNVAMDSARTARRLGAEEVTIVYRRSEQECPARRAELHHAIEEGIEIRWLCNAIEILGDSNGWVRGLRCIRMKLGEPGADGRRRPYPIDGTEFELPVEMVIVAYGNRPHPLVPQTTDGLRVGTRGTIEAEAGTGATNLPGVFAGGDIVTGAATVILAMGAGKDAARAIDRYLSRGGGD